MIRIEARAIDDGMVLRVMGHAGYAAKGQDVICAGVSALVYGFLAYLKGVSPAREWDGHGIPHLLYEEGEGSLCVVTQGLGGKDLQAWRVTVVGLLLIWQAYPAHVQVDDRTECVLWDAVAFKNKDMLEKGEIFGHDGI